MSTQPPNTNGSRYGTTSASDCGSPPRTNSRSLQPIFIVGQYKCGSTWLLDSLSAHPKVIGIAEIDIVRAACNFGPTGATLAPMKERLYRYFDGSGWCAYYDGHRWNYNDVVARLERSEKIPTVPGNRNKTQRFMNLSSEAQARIYYRIKNAERPEEAMDAFLEGVSEGMEDVSHVVLKACDQIAVFDVLQTWRPDAKKLVITRDGRDAAISGYHFSRLMNEIDAPFRPDPKRDYWDLLKTWGHRANMIVEHARRGNLRVIRYEDLTRNYAGIFVPLLAWLGLDHSESIIAEINARTSFEATTGRRRGTEAKHVMRKGAIGEWIEVLSSEDKARAWELVGGQLSALGYRENDLPAPAPRFQPIASIRELVDTSLPSNVTVAVISKGDEQLLNLGERSAWHFPRTPDGEFAGYYPADSAEAIAHLESLRFQGVHYLLVPATSFWWMTHYKEFGEYLKQNYCAVIEQEDSCVVYSLQSRQTSASPGQFLTSPVLTHNSPTEDSTELFQFRCNICGAICAVKLDKIDREVPSCKSCGSTVRWRAVINVLSVVLFGKSVALPDFPIRRDISGIGMTDWQGYAHALSQKLNYRNTFYHKEPRLDIQHLPQELEGKQDFVLSSDVFEHIVPPVGVAFENLRRLLKPGGIVVFTAPYGKADATVEHFSELYDYTIVEQNGEYTLQNWTHEGTFQVFNKLVFHGGPGATLEMRQFGEAPLIEEFRKAGFQNIRIHKDPYPEFGILWKVDWSLPIVATIS
jgi:SAM-dependent methyltransferase